MLRIATCNACNKEFTTSRCHTKTCSSKCRNAQWRLSKAKTVQVRLDLTTRHYHVLRTEANAAGKSINQYAHDRIVQSEWI